MCGEFCFHGRNGVLVNHDASLFHYDTNDGKDPTEINIDRVDALKNIANAETINKDHVTQHLKNCIAYFTANNLNFVHSKFLQASSRGEVHFLLNVLGQNGSIPVTDLQSFIVEEMFPALWTRPREITTVRQPAKNLNLGFRKMIIRDSENASRI